MLVRCGGFQDSVFFSFVLTNLKINDIDLRRKIHWERIDDIVFLSLSFKDNCDDMVQRKQTKNGNLTPKDIITAFGKKFWWQCSKCGYEWQATAAHRKFSKSGCPLCANKVLITGINDLETKAPHIAKEWNYEKNSPIIPSQIHAGSNKKVWWTCSICGKSWQATIISRVHYGREACHSCNLTKERKNKRQGI